MPPRSRKRIWRTISLTASRLVLTMVSSRRFDLPDELAGVDVDRHQGFGLVDDDVSAGFQPDSRFDGFINLLLNAVMLRGSVYLCV